MTVIFLEVMCALLANVVSDDATRYERDIKPVLRARCYACHGAIKQEAGLRLDTGSFMRQGGDNGPVVIPNKPEESRLIERVCAKDATKQMPPEGEPLTATQTELLKLWIADGASSPEGEQPESDANSHWAFQRPVRPEVPSFGEPGGGRNPIDAFVEAELARKGLTQQPLAQKSVILRRVYLDLIGVPPTQDELKAFLDDGNPTAYDEVVERLLCDPRYGQRWGRHWMDVWRYSDWYGRRDVNDVRNSASQIFRWRDWIVKSLNDGKGYDRMIQEMLAADEICPEDYDAGVATGFLIRNYYSLNPNDWMRNAVEHTGKAFLGLTFNCAHCHDHKYDPIAHEDYFRLRAFFEPVFIRQDRIPGEADPGIFQDYSYAGTRSVQRLGSVRVFDRQPGATTWFYTGGDERNRVKERGSIPPGVPTFLQSDSLKIEPVSLPPKAWYPGLRTEIQETMLTEARRAVSTVEEALSATPTSAEAVSCELHQAEEDYMRAIEQSKQSGRLGAIDGEQSLLLDASKGRSIVQNGLKSLREVSDGLTLSFQLMIVKDAHVNFQLVKDNKQGLTADYVAWENGRIMAYKTKVAEAIEVGKYDLTAGQSRFHVTLVLQPSSDQAMLSVRSVADNVHLVEQIPTKLNGWTPIGNELQTISFDARLGSIAVIDNVNVVANVTSSSTEINPATPLCSFDFEPPKYNDGATPAGIDGWLRSTFSEPGGIAVVSRSAGNVALRDVFEKFQNAQRKSNALKARRQSAEMRVSAAHAELASLEIRVAAEKARFTKQSKTSETVSTEPTESTESTDNAAGQLDQKAIGAERKAKLLRAEWELLAQEVALLDAEAKPADDSKRAKEIDTATKGLASAKAALEKLRTDEKALETYSPLSPQYPKQSTGRRKALALWITGRDNPLTARVAVNHIWMRHFRSPLVASPYDFGRNGAYPTHPELLDWLAVEFMDAGWDMKHMHRLIVASSAYRRVSSARESQSNVASDPENKFLWRMNAWRMEAEVVRDSLLAVAGRLDRTHGGVELENTDALTTARRTLYYSSYPEAGGKSSIGELFDAPDPLDCYRRVSSIVPQQSLALTNSQLVQQSSVAMVQAWQASPERTQETTEFSTISFIENMFEKILSRTPTEAERRLSLAIIQRQMQLADQPESSEAETNARVSFVRILFNHNDFVTVR